MTRKKYIHKIQNLMIAIYNHPDSFYPDGYKLGSALKHAKEFAKQVPVKNGSYEAAWNCEAMRWAREHYAKGDNT